MQKVVDQIESLILLDYEITFKKCDEVPGFEMILKNGNKDKSHDTEKCILPYSHLNEHGISKYISHLIAKLGV